PQASPGDTCRRMRRTAACGAVRPRRSVAPMTSARSTPSIEVDTDAAAEAALDGHSAPGPGSLESATDASTAQPRHPAGFGAMLLLGLADLVIDLAVVATAIGVLAAIAALGGALLGWSLTYLVPWLVLGPILGLLVLALLPWV